MYFSLKSLPFMCLKLLLPFTLLYFVNKTCWKAATCFESLGHLVLNINEREGSLRLQHQQPIISRPARSLLFSCECVCVTVRGRHRERKVSDQWCLWKWHFNGGNSDWLYYFVFEKVVPLVTLFYFFSRYSQHC